jgi:hypothetical protein
MITIGACSPSEDKISSSDTASSTNEREKVEGTESSPSDQSQDNSATDGSGDRTNINTNHNAATEDSTGEQHDDNTTDQDSVNNQEDFDVVGYLNENYSIENMYYTITDTWENEETGRTEFIVGILPDTQAYGQEIDEVFKNSSAYFDDERVKIMFDTAEEIIVELPRINNNVHIESILWKSSDDEALPILLIQDRAQSTIEG